MSVESDERIYDEQQEARLSLVPTGTEKAAWLSDWIMDTLNGDTNYDYKDVLVDALADNIGTIAGMVASYDAPNLTWKLDKLFTEALQAPAERAFAETDWKAWREGERG